MLLPQHRMGDRAALKEHLEIYGPNANAVEVQCKFNVGTASSPSGRTRVTQLRKTPSVDRLPDSIESQLHVALDNMPGALVYTDEDLKIVFCNERFKEIVNRRAKRTPLWG
jgi:PAS domain-containing protein